MSATHPLVEQFAGDTWYFRYTLFNQDDTPFNLTNTDITWTLYDDEGNALITKTLIGGVSDGITVVDTNNGICLVSIDATDTDVQPGRYRDRLVLAFNSVVSTVSVGDISVRTE